MGVEDVFKTGPLDVQTLTIPAAHCDGPPKPLLLVFPCKQGDYPPLLFQHGYMLCNSFYTQLLQRIASHGYITIAPQMYCIACLDATSEIKNAVAITDWLPGGLSRHLPPQVRPDFNKLAIAGHSCGGKVAFGAALGLVTARLSTPYVAIIGVDPVGGTVPKILTGEDHSFNLNIPALVIGSGLGSVKANVLLPPCAPTDENHEQFFRECRAPAYHFVATEYGHMDLLDDYTGGVRGSVTYCLCKNGVAREVMRSFSAGIIVAFLNAWLHNSTDDLEKLLEDPSLAPVKLELPECCLLEKEVVTLYRGWDASFPAPQVGA